MEAIEAQRGRTFLLKFEHGEDFHDEITQFCLKKGIKAGHVHFLGAIRGSSVVVGPKEPCVPPEPLWKTFNDGREVVGYGTIFLKDNQPNVHMHTVFSRADDAFIGCVRGPAEVFLIIEAVITEFTNVHISREFDESKKLFVMKIHSTT
jgi:uncharacterized protein